MFLVQIFSNQQFTPQSLFLSKTRELDIDTEADAGRQYWKKCLLILLSALLPLIDCSAERRVDNLRQIFYVPLRRSTHKSRWQIDVEK